MTLNSHIPVFATAAGIWRDTARAICAMPQLFAIVIAAQAALSTGGILFSSHAMQWALAPGDLPAFYYVGAGILQITDLALTTPLAIAVTRFILLGIATRSYVFVLNDDVHIRFLIYLIYFFFISLIFYLPFIFCSILAPVAIHGRPETRLLVLVLGVLSIISAVGFVIFSVRSLIVFPALAVDAPTAGWRNGLKDSRGHFWKSALVFVATFAPVGLSGLLLVPFISRAMVRIMEAGSRGTPVPAGVLATLVSLQAVLNILVIALLAAAASHLYRAYADRLGRPYGLI